MTLWEMPQVLKIASTATGAACAAAAGSVLGRRRCGLTAGPACVSSATQRAGHGHPCLPERLALLCVQTQHVPDDGRHCTAAAGRSQRQLSGPSAPVHAGAPAHGKRQCRTARSPARRVEGGPARCRRRSPSGMKGAASLLSSAFCRAVVASAWAPRNSMLQGAGRARAGGCAHCGARLPSSGMHVKEEAISARERQAGRMWGMCECQGGQDGREQGPSRALAREVRGFPGAPRLTRSPRGVLLLHRGAQLRGDLH